MLSHEEVLVVMQRDKGQIFQYIIEFYVYNLNDNVGRCNNQSYFLKNTDISAALVC